MITWEALTLAWANVVNWGANLTKPGLPENVLRIWHCLEEFVHVDGLP